MVERVPRKLLRIRNKRAPAGESRRYLGESVSINTVTYGRVMRPPLNSFLPLNDYERVHFTKDLPTFQSPRSKQSIDSFDGAVLRVSPASWKYSGIVKSDDAARNHVTVPIIPVAPYRFLAVISIQKQHVYGTSPRGDRRMAELFDPGDFCPPGSFYSAMCREACRIQYAGAGQVKWVYQEERPLGRHACQKRKRRGAFAYADLENRRTAARQFGQCFMFDIGVLGQNWPDTQPREERVMESRAYDRGPWSLFVIGKLEKSDLRLLRHQSYLSVRMSSVTAGNRNPC